MFRSLLKIRYLAIVVVLAFAVHALGFLALGVMRGIAVYQPIARHGAIQDHPGREIAESIDALLFSLVMIVLAVGTASLFLAKPGQEAKIELPEWMRIKSLTELKLLLWEAILATLVVTAATGMIAELAHLEWRHLVTPVAILILSVSYFLLKRTESKD